jgi:hypothetical protein
MWYFCDCNVRCNSEINVTVLRATFLCNIRVSCLSQWPPGLKRGSAVVLLLGLWVRIPPVAWMSVACECCVFSGRGLCVGLITRPEESYRVWCVWVWSWSLDNEEALGPLGAVAPWGKVKNISVVFCARGVMLRIFCVYFLLFQVCRSLEVSCSLKMTP